MDLLGTAGATLMASVGTATGTTFESLVPILVGVAGIYLGFFIVKQVIGLIPKSRAAK